MTDTLMLTRQSVCKSFSPCYLFVKDSPPLPHHCHTHNKITMNTLLCNYALITALSKYAVSWSRCVTLMMLCFSLDIDFAI